MLNVKNIVVKYGGVQAVKGVSLEAVEGAITALIGGNGAGKSSTLRAISGLVPISSGEILFMGERIDGTEPEAIFALGVVHVPEGKRLFLEMSVLDNLLAGAYLRKDTDQIGKDLSRIHEYFPVLGRARHRPASRLSGGEQQMLAIARGLMASPRLLMLDEPSLGLSPLLTREVGTIVERISKEGVPILLVEQNASLAFALAEKIYVMETGAITLVGEPATLESNPHVREAYLGVSSAEIVSPAGVSLGPGEAGVAGPPGAPQRWQDRSPQARWEREYQVPGTPPRHAPQPSWPEKTGQSVALGMGASARGVGAPGFEKEKPADSGAFPRRWWEEYAPEETLGPAEKPQIAPVMPEESIFQRWPEASGGGVPVAPRRVIKKTFVPVSGGSPPSPGK